MRAGPYASADRLSPGVGKAFLRGFVGVGTALLRRLRVVDLLILVKIAEVFGRILRAGDRKLIDHEHAPPRNSL
jgi:hypothetical protein